MNLSSDQLDTVTEIMNIGVGRAAASLSELVGSKILLQVPSVEVLRLESLLETELFLQEDTLASVRQDFRGGFDGQAILILPRQSAVRLASLLAKQSFLENADIDDDCQGILIEVGNILLNAVLGTIASMVSETFSYEVPVFAQRSFHDVIRGFADAFPNRSKDVRVLLVEASFDVSGQCISGQILVLSKIGAVKQLLTALLTA